jgi:heme-degrading monooxygenase HmoA
MTSPGHPVLEVAVLDVKRGQAADFQDAFGKAQHIIASMPGYGRHELRRCVENEHRFLLLVWWDSVESHEVGFRRSVGYEEWRRLLHHFYDPFPTVEHYVIAGAADEA